MLSLRQWLIVLAIVSSVVRVLVLLWITTRCGRFLRGQWWRGCCGQAIHTVVFVLINFTHVFSWTIHAAYLCFEVGWSLNNWSNWPGAPWVFCRTQVLTGSVSIAVNFGLVASRVLQVATTSTRTRSRKLTTVILLTIVPIGVLLQGWFRSSHLGVSDLDYVDVSDSISQHVNGRNVSVDLHLLLCDQGANPVSADHPQLATISVLTEVALVLVLVIATCLTRYLLREYETKRLAVSLEKDQEKSDIHSCWDYPHPVRWVSDSVPWVTVIWVTIAHPVFYAFFSHFRSNSWIDIGVGTHFLLMLSAILVATSSQELTSRKNHDCPLIDDKHYPLNNLSRA